MPESQSHVGHFIQTYSSFLSSFVIGAAGLIATTVYQWNQSKITAKQAESQIHIAETQAENNWKIERAKILAQNVGVLASQGGNNAEQRYGVLVSLTRGNLLDPELAVSYALELGLNRPEYMHSVLSTTKDIDYRRLALAYTVSCEQRYGLARTVDACKGDKLTERSQALAEVVAEDSDSAMAQGKPGPLVLLSDERDVQQNLVRDVWLFTPFLSEQYEKRQWDVIDRFAASAPPARLVTALAVLALSNGVYVTAAEGARIARFHDDQRAFLTGYVSAPSCDGECRAKIAAVMLSAYPHAAADFDAPLRAILSAPVTEALPAFNRINQRLLLCQVTDGAAAALRDQTLLPLLKSALAAPQPDPARLDDLLGLLALVPALPGEGGLQDALQRVDGGRFLRVLAERRAQRQRAERALTPALRKQNFCNAAVEEVAPVAPQE